MRFAYDLLAYPAVLVVVFGGLVLVAYAAMGVFGLFVHARAERRFGEPKLVQRLTTWDSAERRAAKGLLLFVALACGLFALARPQYGKGARLVPATNV
ncbi:MAG TPA: hypothetical protein VF316_19235, partial [Polyangiaceae bacterium]